MSDVCELERQKYTWELEVDRKDAKHREKHVLVLHRVICTTHVLASTETPYRVLHRIAYPSRPSHLRRTARSSARWLRPRAVGRNLRFYFYLWCCFYQVCSCFLPFCWRPCVSWLQRRFCLWGRRFSHLSQWGWEKSSLCSLHVWVQYFHQQSLGDILDVYFLHFWTLLIDIE